MKGSLLPCGAVLLVVAVPNLAADAKYVRRARSAWRQVGGGSR
jgi:hypothetical protein